MHDYKLMLCETCCRMDIFPLRTFFKLTIYYNGEQAVVERLQTLVATSDDLVENLKKFGKTRKTVLIGTSKKAAQKHFCIFISIALFTTKCCLKAALQKRG